MIEIIQKGLANLPGSSAQYQMAGVYRQKVEVPPEAIPSAVMILLHKINDSYHFFLIERTSNNPNDKHSGQISFPGGRVDPDDADMEYTALRETQEEIGISPNDIIMLGALTPIYIPVSNYLVYPHIGYIQTEFTIVPQQSEVKAVLSVPLQHICEPDRKKLKDIKLSDEVILKSIPYFDLQEKVVWGATAMILNELKEIIVQ